MSTQTGAGLKNIHISVEDGVARFEMRDEAGKNTFSRAFVDEVFAGLKQVAEDPSVRVCVISGLPEVFCGGGDRDMLLSLAQGTVQPYDLILTRTLLELPIPTIAAMRGHAVGGGLVFGWSCDMVVLAKESRYGCNFMDLGFTPGMGTTRLLQAAVGNYLATEMMCGAQYFKGKHFEGRSQLNYILSRDEVEAKAMDLASRLADKPRQTLSILKRSLALPRLRLFEEARTLESLMHEISFRDEETRKRIESQYLEIK